MKSQDILLKLKEMSSEQTRNIFSSIMALSKLAAHPKTLNLLPDMKSRDLDMIKKKYFKTINEDAKYI